MKVAIGYSAMLLVACEEPTTPSRAGEIVIKADAPGADVQLALQKGSLRIGPATSASAPTLEGVARSKDPTLLPHVTSNTRGVSVVQDFTPEDASANVAWDLRLGPTPMRLSVHVTSSEEQHVDLGGRSITSGRYYNEGGHVVLDFSAPSVVTGASWELWSIGYLEAKNLGRAGAKRIEVKNVGSAELSVGDLRAPLLLDVVATQGRLSIAIPKSVHAKATVAASPASQLSAEGFHDEAGVLTSGPADGAEATIRIASASGEVKLLLQ